MSYTEIFKFDKNGNSHEFADVSNAYRGSMAVWNYLGGKYLGQGASAFNLEHMKRIWNLANNTEVPREERIVLGTTFDKCLIRKEEIPVVVDAFRKFETETSLNEQADILEELCEEEDCIAVGWHQNSISCDMWTDYNCLEQTDHFWLFDDLD